MSTFKELTYMVLDELKLFSDDATITEEHIIFLLSKYRAFLLKQRYSDIKKSIPDSNYQEICLTMEESPGEPGSPCECTSYYMKSLETIPPIMASGNTMVYSNVSFFGEIDYIPKERFKYVGYNKYLINTVYATKATNDYLYLKSGTNTVSNITSVKMRAMFQDAVTASELVCSKECDILDREFPIEQALIPPLIEFVIKELTRVVYSPEDRINNADDDLSKVQTK